MIWKKCKLFTTVEIDKDQLGNSIVSTEEEVETVARLTPWTDEQVTLEGRLVTKNEQVFAIPIPYDKISRCKEAEIEGIRQEILESIDLCPRYTLIRVRVHKK